MNGPTRLARRAGLDVNDWQTLIGDGRCPLCGKAYANVPARQPVLEHRHADGLVRGITCSACNWRLGTLHDDSEWLLRALAWLSDPPAPRLLDGERFVPGAPPAP